MSDEIPAWVEVGADVLLFTDSTSGPRDVTAAKIEKITATGFTVDDPHAPRFRFKKRQFSGPGFAIRVGGHWGSDRVVVPIDSSEARREIRTHNRHSRETVAELAFRKWKNSREPADRRELISALQTLDKYDDQEEGT